MVVSERLRCVFVHIQKTGGASIEALLLANDPSVASGMQDGRRHLFARDIRAAMDPCRWQSHFKFAFVRNPWDRLVSWYHMCMQTPTPNRFSLYVREHAPTFEAFVLRATTGMGERTTWNQLDFVTDAAGARLVDFVGRYESLVQDMAHVRRTLGLAHDLPHVNRSRHDDYRQYYTDDLRDVVARRFRRDIEAFGYAF